MEKKAKDLVSKEAMEIIKAKRCRLRLDKQSRAKKPKYTKIKELYVFQGYDLLENMIVVRQYVQKKHNIDLGLLEVLLYLNPKQYFTQADYADMPKQFKYQSIKNLIATGFVATLQHGTDLGKNVYKVNRKGHEIVCEFYELLSGEKKFQENSNNPMSKKKNRSAFDKKRMDLIKKINLLPAPESKKGLYQ